MTGTPKINFRGWLATCLQKRRRQRQASLLPPPVLTVPLLVCLGTTDGDTTWCAVAPMAVDDWQFCTNDSVYDPEEMTFQQWVDGADSSDSEFVSINAKTATVTIGFAYCAVRYRVGLRWSDWTGILDRTVIPPPAPVITSFQVVDNTESMVDMDLSWTWEGQGWPEDGFFAFYVSSDNTQGETLASTVPGNTRNTTLGAVLQADDIMYFCRMRYVRSGVQGNYSNLAQGNPY